MTFMFTFPLLFLLLFLVTPSHGFWNVKETETAEEESNPNPKDERELEPNVKQPDVPVEYGVDVSFPMQHAKASDNYAWLPHNLDSNIATPRKYKDMVVQPLGDRNKAYAEFMAGCYTKWGEKGRRRCVETERDRLEMSMRQPKSMQNYTELGYKKIRAPKELFEMITSFWEQNKDAGQEEQWGIGNTYTNNWDHPTLMVSVENSALRGGGYALKQKIWNEVKKIISEWTGEEVTQCSLYGIRMYNEGAVLSPHVDRLPLVSSAIINVAQDLDEPWPLEVIGHDGRAENVTMEPGDMVLYESHSVIHGRPFPLKGRFFASK
jgi:prolyl 4-hydroxylase